jgi:hypothetical protein
MLLTHNLTPYPKAKVRELAVWDVSVPLRLHNPLDPRNTGAAQIREEGTPVEVIAFDDLVRDEGQIRLVKLDCEGAEWPILLGSREWSRVEAVCGEYHLPPLIEQPRDRPTLSSALLVAALERHGFRVELAKAATSSLPVGMFFAQRIQMDKAKSVSDGAVAHASGSVRTNPQRLRNVLVATLSELEA